MQYRVFVGLLALLVLAPPAQASDLEDEAKRQVELARADFANGAFERAANACTSALRLDPTRREAFKIKGLALEQMGQEKEALAMLGAYQSLSSGLAPDATVQEAVARLEQKLEVRVSPVPAILLAGGGVLAVGGFGVSAVGWSQAGPQLNTEHDIYLGKPATYQAAHGLNVSGFILGSIGSGVAIAGLVSLIAQEKKIEDARTLPPPRQAAILPFVSAGPDGAAFGLIGAW